MAIVSKKSMNFKFILPICLILLFLAGCTSQASENELDECEKLTGEGKDMCYYNTSMNAKDGMYCGKIESKDTIDICYYTLVVNYKIVRI